SQPRRNVRARSASVFGPLGLEARVSAKGDSSRISERTERHRRGRYFAVAGAYGTFDDRELDGERLTVGSDRVPRGRENDRVGSLPRCDFAVEDRPSIRACEVRAFVDRDISDEADRARYRGRWGGNHRCRGRLQDDDIRLARDIALTKGLDESRKVPCGVGGLRNGLA